LGGSTTRAIRGGWRILWRGQSQPCDAPRQNRGRLRRLRADAAMTFVVIDANLDGARAADRQRPPSRRLAQRQSALSSEHRFPAAATLIRVQSGAEPSDRSRFETRFYISSTALTAQLAAEAVRAIGASRTAAIGFSMSTSTTTIPPAERPRAQNMPRQTLRHQPGAMRQRQALHQTAPKTRRPGHHLCRFNPRCALPLTWISLPGCACLRSPKI
jgi:hypothetical protein